MRHDMAVLIAYLNKTKLNGAGRAQGGTGAMQIKEALRVQRIGRGTDLQTAHVQSAIQWTQRC